MDKRFEQWPIKRLSCYVDGFDMLVTEAYPLDKQLFSHKFKHVGYRYLVAVALGTSQIVYVGGGVLCGKWPDLKMACETILRLPPMPPTSSQPIALAGTLPRISADTQPGGQVEST
ncbi:hypothetical protein HDU80_001973 [Chytriomyces hyalinus]|nr:hypothetical protein HDU80_001973 [Chytriomyces hyalinus]